MPTKKPKAKTVIKKPLNKLQVKSKKVSAKKTRVRSSKKSIRSIIWKKINNNKWRAVAVLCMFLLMCDVLFTYNFTVRRIVLKTGDFLGLSNQSHDFEGHNIFEVNGITYVAYDHPLVVATVIVDPTCETELCDVNSLKRQILTNLTPAIQFKEVTFDSDEGIRLIKEANAKAVPAFVFDANITLLENFEFIKDFFVERGSFYLLKTPPGRFIATPHDEIAHIKGAENPKVIITEFSSFSCQFCREFNNVLHLLLNKYPDTVAVHYIHFNRGGNDNMLIQASECAAEKNKFWEMHDALFDRQNDLRGENDELDMELLLSLADELDLDVSEFKSCLDKTDRFASKLQSMQKVVADFGIKASPSVFVNSSFSESGFTKEELIEKIDRTLNPPVENVAN